MSFHYQIVYWKLFEQRIKTKVCVFLCILRIALNTGNHNFKSDEYK